MGEGSLYRVTSIALNLRSAPLVRAGSRIEVLAQGQPVTRLALAPDPRWWEVSVTMGPARLQGFVAHAYLEAAWVGPQFDARGFWHHA